MERQLLRSLLATVVLSLMLVSGLTSSFCETLSSNSEATSTMNFESAYAFDVYYGHFKSIHTLYVSIPASLLSYYERKGHFLGGDSDYAKFATPSVFETLAENMRNVTNQAPYSDEQFANAVLTLVRQIPYVKSKVKYPVEAMVDNSGDCDVLSLLAASIMKAGGLDVVLLHYKNIDPSHMNIGVYLPYKPIYRSWWTAPTGFEYNNKTYWMAECTSRGDWKVGDSPELLANAKPRIIPLRGAEKTAPAQVSSSLDNPLAKSAISLEVSSANSMLDSEERSLAFMGRISPALADKNVTVYIGREGLSFETHRTVTNQLGEYSFNWNFTQAGKYSIVTSWSGTADYAGSDSENLTVLAGVYEQIYGRAQDDKASATAASFSGFFSQGPKQVLKSNLSGAGVLLSGEFIILSSNNTEQLIAELSVPKVERVIYFLRTRGGTMRVVISEELRVSKPVEMRQLGFMLRQDGEEEYSAIVSVLEDQRVSQISKLLQESNAAYMNASDVARKNRWYKIEATISKSSTSARIYEGNNTLLKNIAAPEPLESAEIGILMTYYPNSILAFKNLKVSTLDELVRPLPIKEEPTQKREFEWLVPSVTATVLLTFSVVLFGFIKRRRKRR